VGHDLRKDPLELLDKLTRQGFNQQSPTLYVMECVQMYMPEPTSENLLRALATGGPHSYLCCYEPILGSDPFGRVMEGNLYTAGVAQPNFCLIQTRTLEQQLQKLVAAGFVWAVGCDMWSAYETVVTAEQRHRANQCEFLDELEEWILIMRHYCFVVANADVTWEAMGKLFCAVGADSPVGFATGKCLDVDLV
jgi:Leucine carboxyl methyltransferase